MRRQIAILACIAQLVLINWMIVRKEKLLAEGTMVFLELAPVDPRSLMQGDYMSLRFAMENQLTPHLEKEADGWQWKNVDGMLIAKLDERKVANFLRLDDGKPLEPGEIKLRYQVRDEGLKFSTKAFFFQEGNADLYQKARYGEFRVSEEGMLLKGLRDEQLKPLGPA